MVTTCGVWLLEKAAPWKITTFHLVIGVGQRQARYSKISTLYVNGYPLFSVGSC